MLSIERIKEIFKKPDMPDEEATEIRDRLYSLAKIMFEKMREDIKSGRFNPNLPPNL